MLSQHTEYTMETAATLETFHKLSDKWTLWAHLPHNTDWGLKSYIPISTFTTIEETIAVTESLPAPLVENCMLFIMRQGVNPIWEDPKNRNGGCFSYKVLNKNVTKAWSELTYRVVGGSISNGNAFVKSVTGITISPKKNFCIIKIWMSNCDHQNPTVVLPIKGLQAQGCLFKKHTPEY
jgi:hypothetical protein